MENTYPQAFRDALVSETKRRLFEESVPRIKKCLAQLTEEETWRRPNAEVVSVGNLVLHLCGNVRQWILSGLGGLQDHRIRQQEFDETGPIPTEKLLDDLDKVMADVNLVLERLRPEDLLRQRSVQGIFEESGLSILVHVVEHFSYHTGQITWAVKTMKAVDLQYYGGLDLGKKS